LKSGSLVALHGFLGHPDAFGSLALGALAPHVHSPVLLGHGPHPAAPAPTFEAEVERLRQDIEALPRPRRLLAYSQGARVGLGLLARCPDLFDAAVLIGVQPGCASPGERSARRQLEDSWIARLEDQGAAAFVDWWCQLPLFGPARTPEAVRESEPHRYHHTSAGLVSALLVLGTSQMPNLWPVLPTIRCPVELWVGALDAKFTGIAELMAKDLAQARVQRFAGAHHNPLLDCPAEVRAQLRSGLLA